MKEYVILICPQCKETALPPGAYSHRCERGQLFSACEDMPYYAKESPIWWKKNKHKYPVPGKQMAVVPK